MLDNLESYEYPRYGVQSVIFSLHSNGLMCQLPSTCQVIREYQKDSGCKEYTFLRWFKLSSEAAEGYTEDFSSEWTIVPKYTSVKIINNSDDVNLDDFPELKKVVQLMEEFYKEREGKIMVKNERSSIEYRNYIDYTNIEPINLNN